jgi:Lipocalin-like domain
MPDRPSSPNPQPRAANPQFVGVWKLVSCEYTNKTTGAVSYPYGRNPAGRITYDAAGRMSAILMNPGRRGIGSPGSSAAAVARTTSPEELREVLSGFNAYFGTFDVDEASHTVVHHVQAALIPAWVGSGQRRTYQFVNRDQLVLSAPFDQGVSRVVWQREKD